MTAAAQWQWKSHCHVGPAACRLLATMQVVGKGWVVDAARYIAKSTVAKIKSPGVVRVLKCLGQTRSANWGIR